MRRSLRDNGLSLVLAAAFLACLFGHVIAGHAVFNADLAQHGRSSVGLGAYLASGVFLSSLFENWESEFLQMAAYVVLTATLYQRGSAESRDPDAPNRGGDDPEQGKTDPSAPWPMRAGRAVRALYARSLGLALGLLFVVSFVLHWLNSARAAAEDAALHGTPPPVSALAYLDDARFWFESFQNWQSEFLSTAVLVILTLVLRQRGSPESKPLAAPAKESGK